MNADALQQHDIFSFKNDHPIGMSIYVQKILAVLHAIKTIKIMGIFFFNKQNIFIQILKYVLTIDTVAKYILAYI